jgi:hypothetical protein
MFSLQLLNMRQSSCSPQCGDATIVWQRSMIRR